MGLSLWTRKENEEGEMDMVSPHFDHSGNYSLFFNGSDVIFDVSNFRNFGSCVNEILKKHRLVDTILYVFDL